MGGGSAGAARQNSTAFSLSCVPRGTGSPDTRLAKKPSRSHTCDALRLLVVGALLHLRMEGDFVGALATGTARGQH